VDEAEPVELLRAIRSVADGQALLSPSIARRLIDELASQPNPHAPVPERLEELTAREREVMGLVALGFSNREIAARLVVSAATAKTHVSRAMIKLHARDRAQLVALAYQTRLVEPRRSIERGGLRGLVAA
jgi:DNA-binding NarL/FixJ family response regulator